MKRTTITLPDDLALILDREAHRRETSVSDLVRQALSGYLGLAEGEKRRLPFVGLGRSGHHHTGRDLEEILAHEWDDARNR